jgi:hypothetical protein
MKGYKPYARIERMLITRELQMAIAQAVIILHSIVLTNLVPLYSIPTP